jgi:adenylyltransferase/sulfurtransferase
VTALTEEEIRRYSRSLVLPEIGGNGQERLGESKVLVVGAGGLGSPALLYLGAMGVGKVGIVDSDSVEVSNLQRQVVHFTSDIGKLKVESAKEKVQDLNPDVEVDALPLRISAENARELVRKYDAVIDGSDNFPTRYVVNDSCVLEKRPLFSGAVLGFEGQVSTFLPGSGCYRCIFPWAPPPGSVPSCQEAGVLGTVPGIIGLIQATEFLDYALGVGSRLVGRLLILDARDLSFEEVQYKRSSKCPVCGDSPTITSLDDVEYVDACRPPGGDGAEQ